MVKNLQSLSRYKVGFKFDKYHSEKDNSRNPSKSNNKIRRTLLLKLPHSAPLFYSCYLLFCLLSIIIDGNFLIIDLPYLHHVDAVDIYVKDGAASKSSCGSIDNPCSSINQAINQYKQINHLPSLKQNLQGNFGENSSNNNNRIDYYDDSYKYNHLINQNNSNFNLHMNLILMAGVYTGVENSGISIVPDELFTSQNISSNPTILQTFSFSITGLVGVSKDDVVVDCMGENGFLSIVNVTQYSLNSFTVFNCSTYHENWISNGGSAIVIKNGKGSITNMIIRDCSTLDHLDYIDIDPSNQGNKDDDDDIDFQININHLENRTTSTNYQYDEKYKNSYNHLYKPHPPPTLYDSMNPLPESLMGCALLLDGGITTIRNGFFLYNNGEYGGSIGSSQGNRLFIKDSNFTKNYAKYGGAIYASTSSLDIQLSSFEENQAERSGGAIHSVHGNLFLLINNTFTNNSALGRSDCLDQCSGRGGAIYNQYQTGIIEIHGSIFQENQAVSRRDDSAMGGSLCVIEPNMQYPLIQIFNTVFTRNNAWAHSIGAAQGGGAFFHGYHIRILNSLFKGNRALNGIDLFADEKPKGGAIFLTKYSNSYLEAVQFQDNQAYYGGIGGGLYLEIPSVNNQYLTLKKCTFDMNEVIASYQSRAYGGAVAALYGSYITVENSIFTSNKARTSRIYVTSDTSPLNSEKTLRSGSGFSHSQFRKQYFGDRKYQNPHSKRSNNFGNKNKISSSQSNYTNNFEDENKNYDNGPQTYSGEGGAIYLQEAWANISSSVYSNNSCESGLFDIGCNGGAISIVGQMDPDVSSDNSILSKKSNIWDSFFEANVALPSAYFSTLGQSGHGGALSIRFAAPFIYKCSFVANSAQPSSFESSMGGAILFYYAEYTSKKKSIKTEYPAFKLCNFTRNVAGPPEPSHKKYGTKTVNVELSGEANNRDYEDNIFGMLKKGEGGAIASVASTFTLDECIFDGNVALSTEISMPSDADKESSDTVEGPFLRKALGGGIFFSHGSSTNITATTFIDNFASSGVGDDIASFCIDHCMESILRIKNSYFNTKNHYVPYFKFDPNNNTQDGNHQKLDRHRYSFVLYGGHAEYVDNHFKSPNSLVIASPDSIFSLVDLDRTIFTTDDSDADFSTTFRLISSEATAQVLSIVSLHALVNIMVNVRAKPEDMIKMKDLLLFGSRLEISCDIQIIESLSVRDAAIVKKTEIEADDSVYPNERITMKTDFVDDHDKTNKLNDENIQLRRNIDVAGLLQVGSLVPIHGATVLNDITQTSSLFQTHVHFDSIIISSYGFAVLNQTRMELHNKAQLQNNGNLYVGSRVSLSRPATELNYTSSTYSNTPVFLNNGTLIPSLMPYPLNISGGFTQTVGGVLQYSIPPYSKKTSKDYNYNPNDNSMTNSQPIIVIQEGSFQMEGIIQVYKGDGIPIFIDSSWPLVSISRELKVEQNIILPQQNNIQSPEGTVMHVKKDKNNPKDYILKITSIECEYVVPYAENTTAFECSLCLNNPAYECGWCGANDGGDKNSKCYTKQSEDTADDDDDGTHTPTYMPSSTPTPSPTSPSNSSGLFLMKKERPIKLYDVSIETQRTLYERSIMSLSATYLSDNSPTPDFSDYEVCNTANCCPNQCHNRGRCISPPSLQKQNEQGYPNNYADAETDYEENTFTCKCEWFYGGKSCETLSTAGVSLIATCVGVVILFFVTITYLYWLRKSNSQVEATTATKTLEELKNQLLNETDIGSENYSGSAPLNGGENSIFGAAYTKFTNPGSQINKARSINSPYLGGSKLKSAGYKEYLKNLKEELALKDVEIPYEDIELERTPIGQGTFGVVYRGIWRGSTIAAKMMKANGALSLTKGEEMEEIRKEALIMSKLRHPNIALIMGICFTQDYEDGLKSQHRNICIVTEFLEKGSLGDLLHGNGVQLPKNHPKYKPLLSTTEWTYERLLSCAFQAARGILYLHSLSLPVCHRDIKCSNLLVNEHWVVKVTDFGMSKLMTGYDNVEKYDSIDEDDDYNDTSNTSIDSSIMKEKSSISISAPVKSYLGEEINDLKSKQDSLLPPALTRNVSDSKVEQNGKKNQRVYHNQMLPRRSNPNALSMLGYAANKNSFATSEDTSSSDEDFESETKNLLSTTGIIGEEQTYNMKNKSYQPSGEDNIFFRKSPKTSSTRNEQSSFSFISNLSKGLSKGRSPSTSISQINDMSSISSSKKDSPLIQPKTNAKKINQVVNHMMTSNMGTVCWMAPEIFSKDITSSYSLRVDTYSFGMTLWEMIARQRPFPNLKSHQKIIEAIRNNQRPSIPQGCSQFLEELIQECWNHEPRKRPSFNKIVKKLERELHKCRQEMQYANTRSSSIDLSLSSSMNTSASGK